MATVTSKQLKQALGTLAGAGPKKGTRPAKSLMKAEEPIARSPSVEDELVLSAEDMELQAAKAEFETTSYDEVLANAKEQADYLSAVEEAQPMFSMKAQSMEFKPAVPPEVDDGILRSTLGLAYGNLVHYTDKAIKTLNDLIPLNGSARTYVTSITAGAVDELSMGFVKTSKNIADPTHLRQTALGYDMAESNFHTLPTLQATILDNGDVAIKPLSKADEEGFRQLVLLKGTVEIPAAKNSFPLVLTFDKPLYTANKLSGRVVYTDGKQVYAVPGIDTHGLKALITSPTNKAQYDVSNASWMTDPIWNPADALARVKLLFSDAAAQIAWRVGMSRNKPGPLGLYLSEHEVLSSHIWPAHAKGAPISEDAMKAIRKIREAYAPKNEAGEYLLDVLVPADSPIGKEIYAYTRGSMYMADLVDPNAPKFMPMVLARGESGTFLVDKNGRYLIGEAGHPRSARELGLHVGSIPQASSFALSRDLIGTLGMRNGKPVSLIEAFTRQRKEGTRLVQTTFNVNPELAQLWDEYVQEVLVMAKGELRAAETWEPEMIQVSARPSHVTARNMSWKLLHEPRYKKLRDTLRSRFSQDTDFKEMVKRMLLDPVHRDLGRINLFVTNVKSPLILLDTGGFQAWKVIDQMMSRQEFAKFRGELAELRSLAYDDGAKLMAEGGGPGFSRIANVRIDEILQEVGYDHIVYMNMFEGVGVPSFIFTRKGSVRSLTDFGVPEEAQKLFAAGPIALAASESVLQDIEEEEEKAKKEAPATTSATPPAASGASKSGPPAPEKMEPGFYQRSDGSFFEITEDDKVIEHGS